MITEITEKKWFDNRGILIFLFIFIAPLGIYAMYKHKTETWKKVLYIIPASFITLLLIIGIIGAIFSDNYKSGIDYYNKKDYVSAYNSLNLVSIDDKNYKDAIIKINEIKPIVDSINKAKELEDKKNNIVNIAKDEEKSNNDIDETTTILEDSKSIKSQIERELKSIKEGVKFENSDNVTALQMDLVLFSSWHSIILEGEKSSDKETIKLATELKKKVISIQSKEFPLLRKKYAEIVKNKMWESDIDVKLGGSNNTTLNFTGGVFAANKNKGDFQNELNEILTMFRFKKTIYRWYKGEDEYTYYDIKAPKDTEPVIIEK